MPVPLSIVVTRGQLPYGKILGYRNGTRGVVSLYYSTLNRTQIRSLCYFCAVDAHVFISTLLVGSSHVSYTLPLPYLYCYSSSHTLPWDSFYCSSSSFTGRSKSTVDFDTRRTSSVISGTPVGIRFRCIPENFFFNPSAVIDI